MTKFITAAITSVVLQKTGVALPVMLALVAIIAIAVRNNSLRHPLTDESFSRLVEPLHVEVFARVLGVSNDPYRAEYRR